MADVTGIKEHMEVVGADGVHVGIVDAIEGGRIKLTKADSGAGSHAGHHHYISSGLVAGVEGNTVRLTATGANAMLFEEEKNSASVASGGNAKSTTGQTKVKVGPEGSDTAWNWNRIGLAAAAVGAAAAGAGALLLKRNSQADGDDFELRLQTDENVRLIASNKVEGTAVVGADGKHLGTIKSFMVDKYTGRVAYAVLSFGGTFGVGSSLFPLPWPLLDYDVQKDGYVLNITREQLSNAPKFEAAEAPDFDTDYRQRVLLFYRGS
jgi:hypothetical protein